MHWPITNFSIRADAGERWIARGHAGECPVPSPINDDHVGDSVDSGLRCDGAIYVEATVRDHTWGGRTMHASFADEALHALEGRRFHDGMSSITVVQNNGGNCKTTVSSFIVPSSLMFGRGFTCVRICSMSIKILSNSFRWCEWM